MRKNIAEEYLETILYLTRDGRRAKTRDIAGAMGVKPPSVSEMLLKLRDEGFVDPSHLVGADCGQQCGRHDPLLHLLVLEVARGEEGEVEVLLVQDGALVARSRVDRFVGRRTECGDPGAQ